MDINVAFRGNQPWTSLLQCLLLALSYVGSLYVSPSPFPRDHPTTIKKRIKSVMVVCMFAPVFLYVCSAEVSGVEKYSLWTWLGIRLPQFHNALLLPLILTMFLFMGPLVQRIVTNEIYPLYRYVVSAQYLYEWNWHRVYVFAPFTEEFIFRACLIPILVPSFGIYWSILLAPLFFGVAHLHHIIEQIRVGSDVFSALLTSVFQMSYTTLFGVYSAFIYTRTGHLASVVLCHSFCNLMGFPDLSGISDTNYPRAVAFTYLLGLFLFIQLLFPMTDPLLYSNFLWLLN